MRELIDSTSLLGDPAALIARLARDGYLLLRAVLPVARITEAHDAIIATLHEGGWVDATGALLPLALSKSAGSQHPAFRAATQLPEFNRLPYLPALKALAASLLGPGAYSLPSKVLRTTAPSRARTEPGRYAHQDYAYWRISDMLTTWAPLMEISPEHGALAVVPGSHLGPPVALLPFAGTEPGWATTTYRPGDVIVFHCLTAHAALPNRREALRICGDFRWQRPEEPVCAELVRGSTGAELGAQLFHRESWWHPMPAGVPIVKESPVAAPRSRFFAVHPGWLDWQPPRDDYAPPPRRAELHTTTEVH
ncbi:MAG: phytanoyl-CoA dioxygenase family protein [Myxococcaceae bacterium]|nr:phytanoyl-CoA dioxygenase family protein [Myxococcaceae bacterium]